PNGQSLLGIHFAKAASSTNSGSAFTIPQRIPVEDQLETKRFWDLPTTRERMRFEDPAQLQIVEQQNVTVWMIGRGSAEPAAFSPDGRLFAIDGHGGIVLYETASGRPRLRLDGHLLSVSGLAFTPD